jgi:SAM-dependent methyltransferase
MTQEKVGEYWGDFHTRKRVKLSWLESNVICAAMNKRISGSENTNMYEWFIDKYPQKFNRGLIVGCGSGGLERDLYKMGLFTEALGIDIAEASIKLAIDESIKGGYEHISYKVFDLEMEDYRTLGEFDLVIINMVAHHIEGLDLFFQKIEEVLVRGGLIILNEYVGPNRFQHDHKTIAIINALLASFDEKLKINHLSNSLEYRNEYVLTPIQHFIETDPSEAINSENILNYFEKYFNVLEKRNYGGAINHMLLTGIIENFNNADHILKLLMVFEEILEGEGVIQSDFTFVVGAKNL